MRNHVILLLAACVPLACGLATARGQLNPIAYPRLVPHKSKPATPPKARPKDDYHRLLETLIELAWLGDPLTFPYLLEAKVEAGTLRVRGRVHDTVREHAVTMARLQCPLKVIDETKPGPVLEKHTRLNPLVLQNAVQSALREALPRTSNGLRIRCEMDGKVILEGHVRSFAEKLAVSKKLQRLHGCVCVVNRLEVRVPSVVAPSGPAVARIDTTPLVRIRKRPQSRFRTLLCLPGKSTPSPVAALPELLPSAPAKAAPLIAGDDAILRVGYSPVQSGKVSAPMLEYSDAPLTVETGESPFETRGVVILPDTD